MHVDVRDEDFPFKDHYLDVLDTEELVKLRTQCVDDHLTEAIKKVVNRKEKVKKELQSDQLNKEYMSALSEIGVRRNYQTKHK